MLNIVLIKHLVDIKQYKFITRIFQYDWGNITNKSKTEKLEYWIMYYFLVKLSAWLEYVECSLLNPD